jgi:hypothetical protein
LELDFCERQQCDEEKANEDNQVSARAFGDLLDGPRQLELERHEQKG